MKKIFMSVLVLMLTFTCLSAEAGVFGWLKSRELQLSPEVKGQVLMSGSAQAGKRIHRALTYGDSVHSDYADTDANGYFRFPIKVIKTRDSMFDTNVRQEIYIEEDGKITLLWYARNLNTMDYSSFNALLQNMICELNAPEMRYDLKPDLSQPGLYLGVISRCTFVNTDVIENTEINE